MAVLQHEVIRGTNHTTILEETRLLVSTVVVAAAVHGWRHDSEGGMAGGWSAAPCTPRVVEGVCYIVSGKRSRMGRGLVSEVQGMHVTFRVFPSGKKDARGQGESWWLCVDHCVGLGHDVAGFRFGVNIFTSVRMDSARTTAGDCEWWWADETPSE
jgi:hypothetical protein